MGVRGPLSRGFACTRSNRATALLRPLRHPRGTDTMPSWCGLRSIQRAECSTVLGPDCRFIRLHRDDDLASGMVPQHVGDRACGLAEWVHLVDDHLDVARFEECGEGIQVLAIHHTCDELHIG